MPSVLMPEAFLVHLSHPTVQIYYIAATLTPCKVIPDSGICEIFACESGILGLGVQNSALGNLFHCPGIQNPVPENQNQRGGIQIPRLS